MLSPVGIIKLCALIFLTFLNFFILYNSRWKSCYARSDNVQRRFWVLTAVTLFLSLNFKSLSQQQYNSVSYSFDVNARIYKCRVLCFYSNRTSNRPPTTTSVDRAMGFGVLCETLIPHVRWPRCRSDLSHVRFCFYLIVRLYRTCYSLFCLRFNFSFVLFFDFCFNAVRFISYLSELIWCLSLAQTGTKIKKLHSLRGHFQFVFLQPNRWFYLHAHVLLVFIHIVYCYCKSRIRMYNIRLYVDEIKYFDSCLVLSFYRFLNFPAFTKLFHGAFKIVYLSSHRWTLRPRLKRVCAVYLFFVLRLTVVYYYKKKKNEKLYFVG